MRPYTIPSASRAAIEQAVLAGAPLKASAQAARVGHEIAECRGMSPQQLSRALAGDIDNIIQMAMRKEAARRYVSAAALADDIRRHRERFPIAARADTFRYRAAKFVRRNARLVVVAGVAAVALIGAAGVATWQSNVARRRFEDSRNFSLSLLRDSFFVENQGIAKMRADLAQRTTAYLDTLLGEAGGDPEIEADLAEAYRPLGNFQSDGLRSSPGDTAAAVTSFRKAAGLLERVAPAQRPDRHLYELSWVYEGLALSLGRVDVKASLELHRQHVGVMDQRIVRQADDPTLHIDLAGAIRLYGERLGHPYYNNVGDTDGALQQVTRAQQLYETWFARLPQKDAFNDFTLGYADTITAGVFWASGDHDGAIFLQKRAIATYEELLRQSPDRTDLKSELGLKHVRLANFFHEAGRDGDAMSSLRNATSILEPLLESDRTNLTYQRNLIRAYNQTGAVLLVKGRSELHSSRDLQEPRVAGQTAGRPKARRSPSLVRGRKRSGMLSGALRSSSR